MVVQTWQCPLSTETEPLDIGSDELDDDRKSKQDAGDNHVDNVRRIPAKLAFVNVETQTYQPTPIIDGKKHCYACGSELHEPDKQLNRRKYTKSMSTLNQHVHRPCTNDSVYGKTNRSMSENGCSTQSVHNNTRSQKQRHLQERVKSPSNLHFTNLAVNSGHQSETGLAKIHSDDSEEVMETEDWCPEGEHQPSASTSLNERTNITEVEIYCDNLKFYRNKICSRPFPGQRIKDILAWNGDYSRLEEEHSYIQWLFPTPQTSGHNFSAQQLYPHEAEAIRNDGVMRGRVLRAYKMMLDFFGMELVDVTSGEIRRCAANWKERYAHLNTSFHNCMRITRILISLGQLGYARFQVPLVRFLLAETLLTKELHDLNSNSIDYWIEAIVNGDDMFDMMKLRQNMQDNPENFDKCGCPSTWKQFSKRSDN